MQELQNLRRENAELKGQLEEYKRWHERFVYKITEYIPEKYDCPDDPEAIILRWVKNVTN